MNKSDLEKMQKAQEEYEKNFKKVPFYSEIEKIANDIRDRQDNAMAMEFTKTITELLRKNGITIRCIEHNYTNDLPDKSIENVYSVMFDGVDCAEHDKIFIDEIEKLRERIYKQKNGLCRENGLIGLTPIEVAEKLINAESEYETSSIQRAFGAGEKRRYNIFSASELRQIAEHLLVYCNHNSEEVGWWFIPKKSDT